MNTRDYGSGGALFPRQKKNENAPDVGGDFDLTGPELDYVLKCVEQGKPVKLEISGWRRMGRNNSAFTSIKISVPYAERAQKQPQQYSKYPSRNSEPRAGYVNRQFDGQRLVAVEPDARSTDRDGKMPWE